MPEPESKLTTGVKGLMSNIGTFLGSDAAPVVLGGAAEAVMAGHPDTWQAQLGRLGAGLGQSKIAAKAATRQAEERNSYNKLLAGLLSGTNLTPAGTPGPTSAKMTVDEKGQKVEVTGDNIVDPSAVGTTSAPVTAPATAPTARQRAMANPRLLPFYLAASTGSSGGGGGNLFGLSPEQISEISKTDIAGGELSQRGVGEVFGNMKKMALSDYYDRLGYPTPTATKPAFSPQKINAETKTWFTFDQNMQKSVDTGIKATKAELAANGPTVNWVTEEYVTKEGVRKKGRFANGTLITDLGVVPEATKETERFRKGQRDIGEVQQLIADAGDNANSADIDYFNQFSNGQYVYIEVEEPGALFGTNKKVKRVKIPKGKRAGDVFATARKYGISVADVIESLQSGISKDFLQVQGTRE
jgi:hypothetical protein